MRMRTVLLAAILAGGFVLLTSVGNWKLRDLINPIEKTGKLWTEPDVAHSAGTYSADEQNNIDIYKMASETTVNAAPMARLSPMETAMPNSGKIASCARTATP